MVPVEYLLLALALLLLISVSISKLAMRVGIPVLLLFLALGMVSGSDGIGGIYFDNPWLAQSVGVVALSFILFSGGLDTEWREIRTVLRAGLSLSTVGVTITALAVGWFAVAQFGFGWFEGILLGAIIASTDAAAVFAVLRGQRLGLRPRLSRLLELESGSNDPMAVFLTIGMTQLLVQPDLSITSLIPLFLLQMGLGAAIGWATAQITLFSINRLRLEYDGLYPVLTVAAVMLAYGASALVGGNGFLAVYLAGLLLGQRNFIHKRSLLHFHDAAAWLMQILMFVVLGLQVFPSRLPDIAGIGLAIALFVIVVARPLAVFISLALSDCSVREKLFVSWVGLRGAAPIVLATFPLLAGAQKADTIFHIVFFIVLTSVLLQGSLIAPVARLLGVHQAQPPGSRSPLQSMIVGGNLTSDLVEMTIPAESAAVGKQILDLGLPPGILIVLIARGDDLIVPTGSTLIEADDQLLLIMQEQAQAEVNRALLAPE